LTRDSNKLAFLGWQQGDLTATWSFIGANEDVSQPDIIHIAGFAIDAIPAGSSGSLIILTFQLTTAAHNGEQLDLVLQNLRDDIDGFSVQDGSITVWCHDGDVNADSYITAGDASLAFQICLGLINPTPQQYCSADCNADTWVTAGDALCIFKHALALDCACQDSRTARSNSLPNNVKYQSKDLAASPYDSNILFVKQWIDDTQTQLNLEISLLNNEKPVSAFEIRLSYPNTKMKLLSGERGDLISDWDFFDVNNFDDTILIGAFNPLNKIETHSDGSLVTIKLQLNDASTHLQDASIRVESLTDDLENNYELRIMN
jgi:hypothetical protein